MLKKIVQISSIIITIAGIILLVYFGYLTWNYQRTQEYINNINVEYFDFNGAIVPINDPYGYGTYIGLGFIFCLFGPMTLIISRELNFARLKGLN